MKKYNLPTRKQCFDIFKKLRVPAHIVKHCLATAKLAVFLAQRLNEKGILVDVHLVDKACLLHDIFRISELENSEAHEDAAYNLLKEKYAALALAVKKHRYTALLDEKEKPNTWEEKLVYYADKRVMHDRIVSLRERLEEAHKRNAPHPEAQGKIDTAKIDNLIYRLEKEIFDKVGLDPLGVTAEFIDSYLNLAGHS
jgi:putative nucleotidyltransferase with HDIG domain